MSAPLLAAAVLLAFGLLSGWLLGEGLKSAVRSRKVPDDRPPWGAFGGSWWEDPRPPKIPSGPSPSPAPPPPPPTKRSPSRREIRRTLRQRRRERRLKLKSAERRLEVSRRNLEALDRAGMAVEDAADDLREKWRLWDEEESERVREDLLDDLAVLYPDDSDERLREIAAGFVRGRP